MQTILYVLICDAINFTNRTYVCTHKTQVSQVGKCDAINFTNRTYVCTHKTQVSQVGRWCKLFMLC